MTLHHGDDVPAAPCSALVVEDDVDVQQLLRRHLRRVGGEVRAVGTGEEALAAASARPPHLAVVDVLPGIDGRDVVRALGSATATRSCRVVLTSVLHPDEVQGLAVDGLLPKPFSRADVRRVLSVPCSTPVPVPPAPPALEQERS